MDLKSVTALQPPDFQVLFEIFPSLYVNLDAKLNIFAVSDTFATETKRWREDICLGQ